VKSVVPVPPEEELDEEIRLFEVSFLVPLPAALKVPEGAKDWATMVWMMNGIEADTPIVTLYRVAELRTPVQEDATASMISCGS